MYIIISFDRIPSVHNVEHSARTSFRSVNNLSDFFWRVKQEQQTICQLNFQLSLSILSMNKSLMIEERGFDLSDFFKF